MVPPPTQNTVAVCHQIALLTLHYISSRLVTLLKVPYAPVQVTNIFDLTVSFNPGMISVNSQFEAQFSMYVIFLFSACFGQPSAHHQQN